MPPNNYVPNNYLGAMDQSSYFVGLDTFTPVYTPTNSGVYAQGDSGISISDMGTTANPMQNQLQSLQAKIRSGAGKIEFEFMGRQKGNSQQGTPEMYGAEEREMMRKIAEINKVKTSTHATPAVSGLAGMGQRGFSRQQQHETVQEVQRAIDFAKDATTGGAVVVHTGEWQRPVEEYYGKADDENQFELFPGEHEESALYVADSQTGEFVQGIQKNKRFAVPVWKTAATHYGTNEPRQGKDLHGNDVTIEPDDWVDIHGYKINPDEPDELFRRVPEYNEDKQQFEVEEMDWEKIQERTRQFNEKTRKNLTPEVYYAQLQLDNQILQSRGQSSYYQGGYQDNLRRVRRIEQAIEQYKKISEDPDIDEDTKRELLYRDFGSDGILPSDRRPILDVLQEQRRETELRLKHTHEASSTADARALELTEMRGRLQPIEEVGIKRTADALGMLAMEAMEKSEAAKKMRGPGETFEDLYIAPENWHPGQYGSHPDELLRMVQEGRAAFKKNLASKRPGISDQQAEQLAKKHIKTTFDIGHLNMWRSMMKHKPGESEEKFQERFNTWVFDHLEKLHQEDAIGHVHVTDNFGYNDEHVTVGQGNAPVREFVNWMKDRGYKDFIVEAGSFNGETIMHDAWSHFGIVPWKTRTKPSFGMVHNAHAGWYAPPNYMVGAYVPSNEFTLWTGVPLE